MSKLRSIFGALLFLVACCSLRGQLVTAEPHPISLKVSLLDESISPPNFWFLDYSYNPALMLGLEYRLSKSPRRDWHLAANMGYYFHRHFRTAGFLQAGIGYRQQLGRLQLSGRILAGASLAFATEEVYAFEDGDYRGVNNSGSLIFSPAVDFSLGYRLGKQSSGTEIYLNYMLAIDSPFGGALLLPHVFAGLGCRFHPFQ